LFDLPSIFSRRQSAAAFSQVFGPKLLLDINIKTRKRLIKIAEKVIFIGVSVKIIWESDGYGGLWLDFFAGCGSCSAVIYVPSDGFCGRRRKKEDLLGPRKKSGRA
jgi:hypothetical protein